MLQHGCGDFQNFKNFIFCLIFQNINRTKSNQRWMKLRTTVQISSAISAKKPPLKREDSFLKRFSTRQIPETQVSCGTINSGKHVSFIM
jgi:hypothetical protein